MDLNLLVAFEALYAERSVTRAGRRLGLSQPATSAALAKLRTALGDALFVKTPRGLEPTERCEALAKPIARALQDLRDAMGEEDFDPKTTERVFEIGVVDPILAVLVPNVAARVMKEAPRARLRVRSIDPGKAIAAIDARDIDLAIAPVPQVPKHCSHRDLFSISLVVATRPDHPLRNASVSELAKYPHVIVIFAGPAQTAMDDAFRERGVSRHAAVILGSFLAVPEVLATSDAIAFLPAPFAKKLERDGRVRVIALPKDLATPALSMRMIWPSRLDTSTAWRWLRDAIADTKI